MIGEELAAAAEVLAGGAVVAPTGDPNVELINPPPPTQAGAETAWGAIRSFFGQTCPWQHGVYDAAISMFGSV